MNRAEHRSSTSCRLCLLGDFALDRSGREVRVPPPSQKLLVVLALEGRALSRARVAWRLWPDTLEPRAAANLRSALWKLPCSTDLVVADRSAIALAPSVVVDVTALRADAAALRAGVLPDDLELDRFAVDLLPWWYDDWLVIERERLRQVRLHALERASGLLLACHRYDAALDAALLAVGADALRESAHRCVMRVHLAEGNVGEAARQRDRYLAALIEAGLPACVSSEMEALVDRVATSAERARY